MTVPKIETPQSNITPPINTLEELKKELQKNTNEKDKGKIQLILSKIDPFLSDTQTQDSEKWKKLFSKLSSEEQDFILSLTNLSNNVKTNLSNLRAEFPNQKNTPEQNIFWPWWLDKIKENSHKIDKIPFLKNFLTDMLRESFEWLQEDMKSMKPGFSPDYLLTKFLITFIPAIALKLWINLKSKSDTKWDKEWEKKQSQENDTEWENKKEEREKMTWEEEKMSFMGRFLIRKFYKETNTVKNDNIFSAAWNAIQDSWKMEEIEKMEKNKEKAWQLLRYDGIKNKTYNELINTPFEKIVINVEAPIKKEDFKEAYSILLNTLKYFWTPQKWKTQSFFDEKLWKILPDWKNSKLSEIVDKLYIWIWWEKINAIEKALPNIDFSNPWTYQEQIKKIFIHQEADWGFWWIIKDEIDVLKKNKVLDKNFLADMLLLDKNNTVGDYTTLLGNNQNLTKNYNSETINFLNEILNTQKWWFIEWVLKVFKDLGFKNEYMNDFWSSGTWLYMKDLIILYAITWGKTDITQMNEWVRIKLYMYLQKMIIDRNPWKWSQDLINDVMKRGEENKYVKEIVEFLWHYLDEGIYIGMFKAMWLWKEAIIFLNQLRINNPQIFYTWVWIMVISIPLAIYSSKAIIIWSIALTFIKWAFGLAWAWALINWVANTSSPQISK